MMDMTRRIVLADGPSRSARGAAAYCVVVCCVLLAAAAALGDESQQTFELRTLAGEVSSKFAAVRSQLDESNLARLSDAAAQITSTSLELDRLASDIESQASDISSKESTVQRLRIEWESARRRFDEFAGSHDAEDERLEREIAQHNREVDAHEATRPVNGTAAQVDSFNRVVEANNRRAERLKSRQATLLGASLDMRNRLRQEASSKEKDYVLAQAELERLKIALEAERAAFASRAESAVRYARSVSDSLSAVNAGGGSAWSSAGPPRTFTMVNDARTEPLAPSPEAADAGQGGAAADPVEPTALSAFSLASRHALFLPRWSDGAGDKRDPLAESVRRNAARNDLHRYQTRDVAANGTPPRTFDSKAASAAVAPPAASRSGDAQPAAAATENRGVALHVPGASEFVTRAMYDHAVAERARIDAVRDKLAAKSAELKNWRGDLAEQRAEFERIRAQTAENNFENLLEIAQIGAVMKGLSKSKRYKDAISETTVAATEGAEAALRGYLSAGQAADADQASKRFEKVMDANEKAMGFLEHSVALIPDSDPANKYVKGVSDVLTAGSKVAALRMREYEAEQKRSKLETREDAFKTAGSVLTVFFPPGSILMGAGNEAIDFRSRQLIEPAIDDLSYALSRNFDAQQHLRNKLQRLAQQVDEHQRVIRDFEQSQSAGRSSLHD
jgi:hypothetical protein